jgi:DNA-binding Xre family transcriptional regulator
MLFINLKRLFELRGIDKPYTFLRKNGFVAQTASSWSRGEVGYIRPKQLEKLCVALNCTPNDLFEWRADPKTVLPDTHALRTIIRDPAPKPISDMIRDVPVEKLAQLSEMIEDLKA